MEKITGEEAAFPSVEPEGMVSVAYGLTIRQHFAAMAIASGSTPKDAILKADELIKLLNEKEPD